MNDDLAAPAVTTDRIADRYDETAAGFAARYAQRPADTTVERVAAVVMRLRPDVPPAASREIARRVLARWRDQPPTSLALRGMFDDLVREVSRWGALRPHGRPS